MSDARAAEGTDPADGRMQRIPIPLESYQHPSPAVVQAYSIFSPEQERAEARNEAILRSTRGRSNTSPSAPGGLRAQR